MSYQSRPKQTAIPRSESRSSQYSGYSGHGGSSNSTGGGRFTHALSAALKRDDYSRPPLPPPISNNATATIFSQPASYSPEEQLEEVEQKITLTLQAIDANFDHCQRTMARDVMPKVERLAKLSSELLQASQPWLQFFMAVAAADDDNSDGASRMGSEAGFYSHSSYSAAEYRSNAVDDEETRHAALGAVQRAAIEAQAHKGDITARFPADSNGQGASTPNRDGNDDDDDDESIDLDAEIATPQLTSRFMTQELAAAASKKQPHGTAATSQQMCSATPKTPRINNLKRMAEQLSISAKKRRLGTPAKDKGQVDGPATPLSMMRALVNAKIAGGRSGRANGMPAFSGIPGSAASYASKNSSSMGTDDLMPDTSPPHTTTFTLPQSRRIAPAKGPMARLSSSKGMDGAKDEKKASGQFDQFGFGEDDDDDILDEINSLIDRYNSPKPQGAPSSAATSKSTANKASIQWPGSVAKSIAESTSFGAGDKGDASDMTALADKYASPAIAGTASKADEVARVSSLVADMEEMLDEAEAMADGPVDSASPASHQGSRAEENKDGEYDDFDDDIPSPPQIASDLDGSRVVIPTTTAAAITTATTTAATATTTTTATTAGVADGAKPQAQNAVAKALHQPRRTAFGVGASRNMIRMDIEEMDNENMTIGHMSPLANRGRQVQQSRPAAGAAAAPAPSIGSRFQTLDMDDEDDPFGPTPERNTRHATAVRSTRQVQPQSAQSERPMGSSGIAVGGSATHSSSAYGDGPQSTRSWNNYTGVSDSQLNDSSLTLDYTSGGFSQTTMDGTTTILPTREMLQQAAQVAEDAEAQQRHAARGHGDADESDDDGENGGSASDDDEDATRSSSVSAVSHTRTELVTEYSPDLFPPAFRNPPASLQLKALYDLIQSRDQHIWSLEDVAAAGASSDVEELQTASESVYTVLLDLLSRRKLVRKVADSLWSAQ